MMRVPSADVGPTRNGTICAGREESMACVKRTRGTLRDLRRGVSRGRDSRAVRSVVSLLRRLRFVYAAEEEEGVEGRGFLLRVEGVLMTGSPEPDW